MANPKFPLKPNLRKRVRKKVEISPNSLIQTSYLSTSDDFPLVVSPRSIDVNLVQWANSSQDWIQKELLKHGAILFKGFNVDSIDKFENLVSTTSEGAIEYNERAAVRRSVGKKVYTSTEYPADQPIPLHHEMSYSHNYPTKIWFYCSIPSKTLGSTPIANDRKVFDLIDPKIKKIFKEKKVMYIRNYGEGLDLSWQEVFQTEDKAKVEKYCRDSKMICEWRNGDKLRTKAIRQVIVNHPKTNDEIWFNHAHMFHHSNIKPEVQKLLLQQYKEDELPRNALYGDGSPIEVSVLDEIRGIYNQCAIRFDWNKGDILMLDNFLTSHGREPFTGQREILVAMAEIVINQNI